MATQTLPLLKFKEIPDRFRKKTFAIKWPEETDKTTRPICVDLCLDTKGFYLISTKKETKEIECFDVTLIHDTRTGSHVDLPPGAENCSEVNIGALDVFLKSKWLTIVYGQSFVANRNLKFVHFVFPTPTDAREWAEQLFRSGHNQRSRNLSSLDALEKLHSRIFFGLHNVGTDERKISVQHLTQFLCKNTRHHETEKKISHALERSKLKTSTDSSIDRSQLTFEKFFEFYLLLFEPEEMREIFNSTKEIHRRNLSWNNFKEFLSKQKDRHGTFYDRESAEEEAKDLLKKFVHDDELLEKKEMPFESFVRFWLSYDNFIVDTRKLDVFMDMDQPLAHYWIASSHNTYLTGSQWTGRASLEMYRQVLLTGCRCIELDVIDSDGQPSEPEIKHKNTPVRPVPFIDVILTIEHYAFKVTPYPLTLSFENYCSPPVQNKMAQYLIDILKSYLLTEPLESHPCEENRPLPSPNALKYKILIKNKKLEQKSTSNKVNSTPMASTTATTTSSDEGSVSNSVFYLQHAESSSSAEEASKCSRAESCVNEDEFFSDEENSLEDMRAMKIAVANNEQLIETQATKAVSDLVHYTVPVHFKSLAEAEKRQRSFEMSSFPEDRATELIRCNAKGFLAYNERQMSRIYPMGKRVGSSNYPPHPFWSVGCQMVALNYQTLDIPMQLNLAFFSFNGACGYLEKPLILCQKRNSFDPRTQTKVENVAAYQITVKILSGHFFCQDREPTLIDAKLFGIDADSSRRNQFQIRLKEWNGFKAVYNQEIQFSQVILPDIAGIRLAVCEEDEKFIGQCFIPVAHLQTGYRHIVLRNEMNLPINCSTLIVYIRRTIYLSAEDEKFADRLVTPVDFPVDRHVFEDQKIVLNFSNSLVRTHEHSASLPSINVGEKAPSFDASDWYQPHLIAASQFHLWKSSCKLLTLNELEKEEQFQHDRQNLPNKLRRLSVQLNKGIQHEESSLNDHPTQIHRSASMDKNCRTKDSEKTKQKILSLCEEKYRRKFDIEFKHLKEYYKKLEERIRIKYEEKNKELDGILKKETSRAREYAEKQKHKEIDQLKKTEKNKQTIAIQIKEIEQTNRQIETNVVQILTEMYTQLKSLISKHHQVTTDQLNEQRDLDIERCLTKYSDQYQEKKIQLSLHDDDECSAESLFSRARNSNSASLGSFPTSSNSFYIRRQTTDS